MWWWVRFRVFELFVLRIWRICRFWPQALILWGRGCFAVFLHGCLNVCRLFCKHNTSCVSQKTKQRFVSLGECGLLSIYTHSTFFFGSAWHLEIPTYWEWLLIDTCTTPYSYLHPAAMIAQCLIRLEARFLACLFLFSLKLECEKLVQEKTEMQRHYVMVSGDIFGQKPM